jgi:hypothetical protein
MSGRFVRLGCTLILQREPNVCLSEEARYRYGRPWISFRTGLYIAPGDGYFPNPVSRDGVTAERSLIRRNDQEYGV